MNYKNFIMAYAQRLGVVHDVAQFIVDELCEEVIRQLLLGEDVRLPKLGKFTVVVPKVRNRVSNLPGIEGKISVPRTRKRLDFKSFHSAVEALSRQSFVSMVSGANTVVTDEQYKVRKGATMAKKKSGRVVTVDIPEGVECIVINTNTKKKKSKGKGESTSSKRRLLG